MRLLITGICGFAGITALGLATWLRGFSVFQHLPRAISTSFRFGVSVSQSPATSNPPQATTPLASPTYDLSPTSDLRPPISCSPLPAPCSSPTRRLPEPEFPQVGTEIGCRGNQLIPEGHSPLATSHSSQRAWLARFAVVLFLLVLLGMYALGKFPTYYGWMLTFPLAAILAAMFDSLPAGHRVLRAGAVAIAVLACVVGFPVQAAVALNDWPYRTPEHVDEWLLPQIQADDIVYCDYPFYYIAKERAHKVFVGFHSRVMTPEELDSLDLVLLSKTFCDWSHPETLRARATGRADWDPSRAGLLGNDWRYGILSAPNYSCAALRLAPVSGL